MLRICRSGGGTVLLYKVTCATQEEQEKRGPHYVIDIMEPAAGPNHVTRPLPI
jgi:hypothetical protein